MTAVQVWADVRCPWCWMGHRRLAEAVRRSGAQVRVERRSFLLEPRGPATSRRRVREVALTEWGMSEAGWAANRDRIERAGRADGLVIRIDSARSVDSRPAHRVLKLAAARGLDAEAAWDAMFAAHLEHNLDLEDWDVLAAVGTEAGLDRRDVLALAGSDDLVADVHADVQEAQAKGIHSVPTLVHGDQGLSGARSVPELVEFVRSAAAKAVG